MTSSLLCCVQILGKEEAKRASIADLIGIEKVLIAKAQIGLNRHDPRDERETARAPYEALHQGDRYIAYAASS
jgi:hypothetical protein